MRWHCPPDRGCEIRALVVLGRARYLSVTEAHHNIGSLRLSGKETFCLFETWRPEWGSNPQSSTSREGSFNHCTKPPPYHIVGGIHNNRALGEQGGGPRVVVSTAAFHARVRGSVPGLGGLKVKKLFLPHPRVKVSIVGSLCDREVACSASDRQGSNFESCVWRTVSSQSYHHPQEVLLAQFSLYVHKGGLKPDSFHFYLVSSFLNLSWCWYGQCVFKIHSNKMGVTSGNA